MVSSVSQAHVYGSASYANHPLNNRPSCRREAISHNALLFHLEHTQCGICFGKTRSWNEDASVLIEPITPCGSC